MTSLGVLAAQPDTAVVSALVVYPAASVVLVGNWRAVIVTGKLFGLLMETVTSPLPPGYSWFVPPLVALMVRLLMAADWDSPAEPPFSPTTQFVAAYAALAARRLPQTAETIFLFLDHRVVCMFPVFPSHRRSSGTYRRSECRSNGGELEQKTSTSGISGDLLRRAAGRKWR